MDELEAIRVFAADRIPVDAEAEDRAWAIAREHLVPLPNARVVRTRPHRPKTRTMAIASAIAALILVASALLPGQLGGPHSAQAALEGLAQRSAVQPPLALPPGSWLFTRKEQRSIMERTDLIAPDGSWTFRLRSTLEMWQAADGSGTQRTSYGQPSFLDAADESAWEGAGSPPLIPHEPVVESFGPGSFEPIDLSQVPTDVDALRMQLEDGSLGETPPGDLGTFDLIGDLMADQLLAPELRSSLFLVAASLDPVEDLGTVEDPMGHSGEAIKVNDGERSTTLIFDPASGRLLSRVSTMIFRGDTVTIWQAFEPAQLTESGPPESPGK
jgi:hypothetical protein